MRLEEAGPSWREKASLRVRVRDRLRAGWRRLWGGWWQILQTAVAAGIAWALAYAILGRAQPDFAPIAAVLTLGLAVGERGRRAVELVFGVAFGVALSDLLVYVLGLGPVQIAAVVALAMSAAVFLGRGDLGVSEAAVSSIILIIAFEPSDLLPSRFFEALIGGGAGLLVNALLPINPERMVQRAAHPVFDDLVAVLEEVASALDDGDFERAERAMIRAREIDARVSGFKEALEAGRETARLAPPRRRSLGHLELYASAADQIDLTVRDVRGLSRTALSVVQPENPAPERLTSALRSLGRATEALAGYLDAPEDPEDTRRFALEAVREATALLREREDLAAHMVTNALVDQIHSASVDILGGTGLTRPEALQALREAMSESPEGRVG